MALDEQRIYDKLDAIDDKTDKLINWQSGMEVRCEEHRKQTDGMHQTLYAEPDGLQLQVKGLMNGNISISRWRDWGFFVLRGVVTVAIVGFAAFLLRVYKVI